MPGEINNEVTEVGFGFYNDAEIKRISVKVGCSSHPSASMPPSLKATRRMPFAKADR